MPPLGGIFGGKDLLTGFKPDATSAFLALGSGRRRSAGFQSENLTHHVIDLDILERLGDVAALKGGAVGDERGLHFRVTVIVSVGPRGRFTSSRSVYHSSQRLCVVVIQPSSLEQMIGATRRPLL